MKYINIFPHSIISKGINRCLIFNLNNKKTFQIPHDIYNFLTNKYPLKIDKNDNIYDFIIFLKKNDILHITSNPLNINKNLEWDFPNKISNAIIEFDGHTLEQIQVIINNLIYIKCPYIEIRIYSNVSLPSIKEILNIFKNTIVKGVYIYAPFYKNCDENKFLLDNYSRLKSLVFFGAIENSCYNDDGKLYMEVKDIINAKKCGLISSGNFSFRFETYTESLNHNTCLNRKISVDKYGNIKNCPSMSQSFGNIKDTTLKEALNHPSFKKYWNVTKDQIEVCRDCEFRHVCTDCRAYTERTHFEGNLDLSKPLKCGYDPYTNEWAEWSTNPLKQKAIEYYEMQELIKNV